MELRNRSLVLVFIIICLWTQGNASHKSHKVKKKGSHNKSLRKNIPRSALVGIKPEELAEHPVNLQNVQGAKKSYMKIIDLPAIEESQRMESLSRKASILPPGEKIVIQNFLKDMERSHGELTPSVMKKMVELEGFSPSMNSRNGQRLQLMRSREQNLQGSQRSLDSIPQPTNAMNPSVLPFKLGGSSATFSNTESELGEETPAYLSNPLPEYDYKELKYNLPTSMGSDFGDGYHGNDEDEDFSKTLEDYESERKADGDEAEDKTQNTVATLVGNKGENLINEIGRRVLLSILEKQKQKNEYEKATGKGIPDLLGAASMDSKEIASQFTGENSNTQPSTKDTSVVPLLGQNTDQNGLLQNKNSELQKLVSSKASPSTVAKAIADLGTKALGSTKLVTQEAQTPVENELNGNIGTASSSLSVSTDAGIDVSGKVNNVIASDNLKSTPIVTTTTPTKTMSTTSKILSNVGRTVQTVTTDNAGANSNDVVVLKISGQGKPVSFNADAGTDGSIVLKIPKKYSENIIQTNEKSSINKGNDAGSQVKDSSQNPNALLAGKMAKSADANTHPGDLSGDAGALLAGKNTYLQDAPQISNWVISGKKNPSQYNENMHPTRNVLPQEQKETLVEESKTSDELLQRQKNWNQSSKALESRQSLQQSSTGLPVPQDSSRLADTPQSLAESVFPNVAGKPFNSQNMEQLMTLLAHMEQLPAAQVGVTAFDGMIPTNYGVRQTVGRQSNGGLSLKSLLKSAKLMEDSGVARNKGTEKDSIKDPGNEWSPCTVTCGRGIQARARPCSGHDCSGFTTESRPCNAGPCPEQLAKEGLKMHNKFRKWHGVPALKWSPSLAKKAQKLAQDLALNTDSAMEAVEMNELPGENTAKLQTDYTTAAESAVKQWYEEVKGYSFGHPSLDDSTKHFSQVVWKETKEVGMGLAKSKNSNKVYVIALYDPPGNMEGKEKDNIKMPDMARS